MSADSVVPWFRPGLPMADGAAIEGVMARRCHTPAVQPPVHPEASPLQYPGVAPAMAAGFPQIVGERARRFHFLEAWQIDYLAVEGNYVIAHLGDQQYLTRATLKYMASELAPYGFVRIERSLLVNLRRVAHVERLERGQYAFVMHCGLRLHSSRERSAALRQLLTAPLRRPTALGGREP